MLGGSPCRSPDPPFATLAILNERKDLPRKEVGVRVVCRNERIPRRDQCPNGVDPAAIESLLVSELHGARRSIWKAVPEELASKRVSAVRAHLVIATREGEPVKRFLPVHLLARAKNV